MTEKISVSVSDSQVHNYTVNCSYFKPIHIKCQKKQTTKFTSEKFYKKMPCSRYFILTIQGLEGKQCRSG